MKNLLLLCAVAFFASCTQYDHVAAYSAPADAQYGDKGLSANQSDGLVSEATLLQDSVDSKTGTRMVVRSADLKMEVKDSEATNDSLRWIAKRFGGYLVKTSTYGSVLRVDHDQLDEAVDMIAQLGKVKVKTFTGSDETINYYDMGIRLDNARRARERYLSLLASANNVEEALLVERELERLNRDIDLLSGRRRGIERLVVHSTISIDFHKNSSGVQQTKPGPIGYVFIGLWKGVKWLFVRG